MSVVKDKQVELSAIHDFGAKLCQPDILPRLKEYVRWQVDYRKQKLSSDDQGC